MQPEGKDVEFSLRALRPHDTVRDCRFGRTGFIGDEAAGRICYVAGRKYVAQFNSDPGAVGAITTPEFADLIREDAGLAVVEDGDRSFFELHNELTARHDMRPAMPVGIDKSAQIHATAIVEPHCYIGASAVIEAGAIVKSNSWIEDGCFIGAGAVIGVVGLFNRRFDGQLFRVEHSGGVRIGRTTQVLAHAIVQKAVFPDFTDVGEAVVLGPGVHLGHGVKIGDRSTIAGSAQIAGYSLVGKDVWIGPSAAISNLVQIGDGARVEIGSVVAASIEAGGRYSSPFAMPHIRNLRAQAKARLS